MTRRIVVLGLGIGLFLGARPAWSQEAGKPAPAEAKRATPPDRGPWQAAGTQGAVAAGGRGAVAAGLEILEERRQRGRRGRGDDPGALRHRRQVVLFRRRGADSGLRCPATRRHGHRRSRGGAPARDSRRILEARRHSLEGDPRRRRSRRARCLPDPARPLRHHDLCAGGRPDARIAPASASTRSPGTPISGERLQRLVEAEAQAHPAGSSSTNGDRSRGLRLVADAFYRGPIARRIDAWSRASGGLIRYVDLATHTTRVEEPVAIAYRGLTVFKCGAWTQGPYLLEALQILKDIDLKAMGHNRPDAIHTIVETMKLTMADRDTYYADPLFADVPLAPLLSPEYAALRRGLIDPKAASLERRPGDPRSVKAVLDPAADPARRHVSRSARGGARHHDLRGRRPLRQRRGRDAQRLDGRRRRRYRRLAWEPACRASTCGTIIPTSSSPASARGSRCLRRWSCATAGRSWP